MTDEIQKIKQEMLKMMLKMKQKEGEDYKGSFREDIHKFNKIKKLVILPTYNESKNIITMLDTLIRTDFWFKYDILVIDDNSPDGTAEIVRRYRKKVAAGPSYNIIVKVRSKKDGLGSAYVHAFNWAIENNYEYIVQMDADLSHNPREIWPMIYELHYQDYDLVIGSRYSSDDGTWEWMEEIHAYDLPEEPVVLGHHGEMRVVNWPRRRLYLSYFANLYARIITGVPVKDLTAGFKAWRADTLRKINFNECSSQGYCFQIETAFRAYQKNCKIIEHPITFIDRTVGESKMDKSVIIEAILKVWLFGFWRLFRLKR